MTTTDKCFSQKAKGAPSQKKRHRGAAVDPPSLGLFRHHRQAEDGGARHQDVKCWLTDFLRPAQNLPMGLQSLETQWPASARSLSLINDAAAMKGAT